VKRNTAAKRSRSPRPTLRVALSASRDLRKLVVEGIDKRGRSVGAFESRREQRAESAQRIRCLRRDGSNQSLALADKLQGCRYRIRCQSMACPVCARLRRLSYGATVLRFVACYPLIELHLVTLINPSDAFSAGQLHNFDPTKLISRLRRQLERAGIAKVSAFLIGAVDGEWDAGWSVFQPHAHLLVWCVSNSALKTVTAKWIRSARVRVRKRSDPIDDLPRVVAYLEKSFWPAIVRKKNPLGMHPHGKRRPLPKIEAEILQWLDRQSPRDMRILFGAKIYGRSIRKTSCSHENTRRPTRYA
jgi:hypothetical protein